MFNVPAFVDLLLIDRIYYNLFKINKQNLF